MLLEITVGSSRLDTKAKGVNCRLEPPMLDRRDALPRAHNEESMASDERTDEDSMASDASSFPSGI